MVHSAGPVLLADYASNPNISAILWAGMPGEQSGNSIVDVLYGRVNPSAKTPFTWAKTREDYGTDVLYQTTEAVPQIGFTEGNFIDYRALDRSGKTPVYPFGFGLSYTTFSYSNLQIVKRNARPYTPNTGKTSPAPTFGTISNRTADYLYPANFTRVPLYIYPYLNFTDLKQSANDPSYGLPGFVPPGSQDSSPQPKVPAGGAPGGNPQLYDVLYEVSATVTNTGKVSGMEVPQMVSLYYPPQSRTQNSKMVLVPVPRISHRSQDRPPRLRQIVDPSRPIGYFQGPAHPPRCLQLGHQCAELGYLEIPEDCLCRQLV